MRNVEKFWLAWGMAFLCLGASAQVNLQIDLAYFGANPATNRQVSYQQTTPFLGNLVYATSDSVTGMVVFPSVPSGVLNIVIASPPGARIPFSVNILPTDSGTVDATNRLNNSGPTYPAGLTSWAIATSDTRYALSTNQAGYYVALNTFTNATNVLQLQINSLGGSVTNAQVTNIVNGQIIASNLTTYAALAAGTNAGAALTTAGTNAVIAALQNSNLLVQSASSNIAQSLIILTNASIISYVQSYAPTLVGNLSNSVYPAINTASNITASTALANLQASNAILASANSSTSNALAAALVLTNFQNLQLTTNLINNSSNGALAFSIGVSNTVFNNFLFSQTVSNSVNTASNALTTATTAAVAGTNSSLLGYILTNNPTFAGFALSNFQNLSTTTNLVATLSNNLAAYSLGVSNITVNNQIFAATTSNSLVTASNTIAANALANLQNSNANLTASIIATNSQIIAVVNIASNGNAAFSAGLSNSFATGTNTTTSFLLSAIQNTNIANLATNAIRLNSASNVIVTAMIASNGVQTAALTAGTNAAVAYTGIYLASQLSNVLPQVYGAITTSSNVLVNTIIATNNQTLAVIAALPKTNLAWGTSLTFNANARPVSEYLYVSNSIPQYFLITTN